MLFAPGGENTESLDQISSVGHYRSDIAWGKMIAFVPHKGLVNRENNHASYGMLLLCPWIDNWLFPLSHKITIKQ